MADMISGVLNVTVAILLMTSVVLYTIHNTSTTGWSASEIAVFGITGLVTVVGIVYLIKNTFIG